ncbi:MAG: polypeptide subunit release factor methylase [Patiriisocius sp.]|jgi:methylase of polypeptide subunit release factors
MASHQEIAGVSDEDLVQRMINSHGGRFGEDFWQYVEEQVETLLPSTPRIVDLGCGPGLLVRDFAVKFPDADIYGFDLTPAMSNYENSEIQFEGNKPTFGVLGLTASSVPLEDGSGAACSR